MPSKKPVVLASTYSTVPLKIDSCSSQFASVDLFCGAGGMALGLSNAGFRHSLLVDNDKWAVKTLQTNRPDWPVAQVDISALHFGSELPVYYRGIDLVTGGFPCQPFSYTGKKLGFDDIRGTLAFDFMRCVSFFKPKVLMAENVSGLLNHDKGRTLATIVEVANDIGYNVVYRVVQSQYLDVPQRRERLILIGVRKDIGAVTDYKFPAYNSYQVSVRQALKDCPPSEGAKYTPTKAAVMQQVPEGGNWRDLPVDVQRAYMKANFYASGGKTSTARRLAWDEPSLTLTCSPAQSQTERCHPVETRPLTVREYARIQTFPDDWQFAGSITHQYRQIGNAVPVNMAYHLGRSVIELLNRLKGV